MIEGGEGSVDIVVYFMGVYFLRVAEVPHKVHVTLVNPVKNFASIFLLGSNRILLLIFPKKTTKATQRITLRRGGARCGRFRSPIATGGSSSIVREGSTGCQAAGGTGTFDGIVFVIVFAPDLCHRGG